MKYYLFILSFLVFSSYAAVPVNLDSAPEIYIGEMSSSEEDSEGFYRAKLFGVEYVCYNCTDDFGKKTLNGIWHRNLPDDDKSFNPKNNICSSYNLDWRIKGFFVDFYKREGISHKAPYITYSGGCFYSFYDKSLSSVENVSGTTMLKKLTLAKNFQPYLKGFSISFLPWPFVSDLAKNASLSLPGYQQVRGDELLKQMFSYARADKDYPRINFYVTRLRDRISPYELYDIDLAKYYLCVNRGVSSMLNNNSPLYSQDCSLNPALKIVNGKIYLKDEEVTSGGGSGGTDGDGDGDGSGGSGGSGGGSGDVDFGGGDSGSGDSSDGGSGGGGSSGGGSGGGGSSGGGSSGGGSSGGGSSGGGSSGGGSSGGGSSGGGSSGGGSSGGGGSDSGSGGGATGGGDSGTGNGTGGGSGTGGDGTGGGNTDGDGDLLGELKAFHRSFKDSLIIDDKLPDYDKSDLDFSDFTDSTNGYLDNIEKSFNSSLPSYKSSYDSLKKYVPDMSLKLDGINNSMAGITGVCRPITFDLTLGLAENKTLHKTVVLTDFCIWYDQNIRGFVTWVFKFMTAVAVYFIVVRGLQKVN